MSKIFARIQQNKHFKYGIPFFAFIFGGKLLLEELRSVRYDPVLNPKGNKKLSKYLYILGDLQRNTVVHPKLLSLLYNITTFQNTFLVISSELQT